LEKAKGGIYLKRMKKILSVVITAVFLLGLLISPALAKSNITTSSSSIKSHLKAGISKVKSLSLKKQSLKKSTLKVGSTKKSHILKKQSSKKAKLKVGNTKNKSTIAKHQSLKNQAKTVHKNTASK
jgi:hypothetical protein